MKSTSFILFAVFSAMLFSGCSNGSVKTVSEGNTASGTLLYSSGNPAPLIPMVLKNSSRPFDARQAVTDDSGHFVFTGLNKAEYILFALRVYSSGKVGKYETMDKKRITVLKNKTDLGTIRLKPAAN